MKKLINSFKYAICGIKTAIKRETNLKIHIFIMLIVIIFGVVLKIHMFLLYYSSFSIFLVIIFNAFGLSTIIT